jgi:dephospho-CoA kinase
MVIAGVTGGIGSGKTTVCREWEKLGAYVFYADDEAKKLMVSSEDVVQRIRETFGEKSYHKDGSLNKPHLIREAFDAGRVEELNKIVHPAVGEAFEKACENAQKEGYKVAVKEAALLLNNGRPGNLDKVIIVSGDESIRLRRVMERDQSSSAKIKKRMEHQPDFEKKHHLADFIINNNGTLSDLKKEAERVYHKIVEEADSAASTV